MFLRFLLHASRLMLCCIHRQNVFLSQSHISLGNIPVQTKCSRLLFLNNISKSETIVFTWQPKSLDFGEVGVLCSHNQNLWPPHPTSSHPVLSRPLLSRSTVPHLTPSRPVPSWPLLSRSTVPHLTSSRPVLFHCLSSRPILSHPSHLVRACLVLSSTILPPKPTGLSLNQ